MFVCVEAPNWTSGNHKLRTTAENSFECAFQEKEARSVQRLPDNTALRRGAARIAPRPLSLPLGDLTVGRYSRQPNLEFLPESISTLQPWLAESAEEPELFSKRRSVDGLDELNHHTEGPEYYGRTGTFYFLSRLRSRASSPHQQGRHSNLVHVPSTDHSVVNLLHSTDYGNNVAVSGAVHQPDLRKEIATNQTLTTSRSTISSEDDWGDHVERECVRLFFQNLHCIHPVLDQQSFLTRCSHHVWQQRKQATSAAGVTREKKRFLALYNAVLSLGAVIADQTSLLNWERTTNFLERVERQHGHVVRSMSTCTSIVAARWFFDRSKALLEDVFESGSLESVQTLFFQVCNLRPLRCHCIV